jgi:hypothetical protein
MNRIDLQFSPSERSLVARALREAEDRTSRYYCIPPYQWQRLSYDVLTREDRDWRPLPDDVLAEVLYMQRSIHQARERKCHDFYRIQLDDEGILRAAHREDLDQDLYPFLVYILTHEMVHLVRLSTILEPHSNGSARCESEEERVHRISRQILARSEHPGLAPVLERFCVRAA